MENGHVNLWVELALRMVPKPLPIWSQNGCIPLNIFALMANLLELTPDWQGYSRPLAHMQLEKLCTNSYRNVSRINSKVFQYFDCTKNSNRATLLRPMLNQFVHSFETKQSIALRIETHLDYSITIEPVRGAKTRRDVTARIFNTSLLHLIRPQPHTRTTPPFRRVHS